MAIPAKLQAEIAAAQEASLKRALDLIAAYPRYRDAIAAAELGSAIGLADMVGVDVEGFLRHVRAEVPKPAPLKPPTAH